LLNAARGRCVAAHFGTYDYTASCSITAAYQDMLHPACDFARHMMQVSFGGTGVWLSDGATNILPVAPHRGELTTEQQTENRAVVHRAWKLHYEHVRHSLTSAFYQGWDLHPAQLPTRYAAVYTFFLEGLAAASERLRNFVAKAAQATLVGDVFDDAATGQGLLNYFLRAINCRALTEQEAQELTSLTLEELRSGRSRKFCTTGKINKRLRCPATTVRTEILRVCPCVAAKQLVRGKATLLRLPDMLSKYIELPEYEASLMFRPVIRVIRVRQNKEVLLKKPLESRHCNSNLQASARKERAVEHQPFSPNSVAKAPRIRGAQVTEASARTAPSVAGSRSIQKAGVS
jgi:hypothetical protein